MQTHSAHEPAIVEAQPVPLHWTPLSRLAFRIAFLYFFCFLFLFGNGSLFLLFPVVGAKIDGLLTWPMNQVAQWVGQHIFHLTGRSAAWHRTGSGDTALNWINSGLFVVFSIGGGLIWTAISAMRRNPRTEYQTLYAWLRFLLRLTLGMFMLQYGMAKVFPLQMPRPSVAILTEPIGQSSPMTLLWSLIGLNPVYESICGLAEVLGGLLILFRRTALAGALLSVFVLANVVLYNFFFDVPVKLFALNLMFAASFAVLPDAKALFDFFWLHRPAAPAGIWVPPASRRGFRIAVRTIEIVFTLAILIGIPYQLSSTWRRANAAANTASPLLGAWHLNGEHAASGAFLTADGLPATDLYIDSVIRAYTRSSDGQLWRTRLTVGSGNKISLWPNGMESVDYTWTISDSNRLILTPVLAGNAKGAKVQPEPKVVTLTRTPTPSHYPLLDRGFHFVNEWGLER